MKQFQRLSLLGSVLSLAVSLGITSATNARQTKTAAAASRSADTLAPKQRADFADALRSLASQTKIAFVAEGVPLPANPLKEKAVDLSQSATLEAAIDRLAAAYDFDAKRRGKVFVFKKRYTNPFDLPGLTMDESELALQDVLRILTKLNPRVPVQRGVGPNGRVVLDVAKALTPQQLQALQNQNLRVVDLNPQQRTLVERVALRIYAGLPTDDTEAILGRLKLAEKGALRKKEENGQKIFGYEYTAPDGQFVFQPLESPIPLSRVPGGEDFTPPDLQALTSDKSATTLGSVVAVLSKRAGIPVTVDPALSAKLVTVAGADFAPPLQVLAALADVYGLRIKEEQDGTRQLIRVLWRVPTRLVDLPAAVRRVLPESLLRFTQSGSPGSSAQHDSTGPDQQRARQSFQARPNLMAREAMRRLRAVVEPELDKVGEAGRVPIASLSDQQRGLFSLLFLQEFLYQADILLNSQPPAYIARFDQLYLSGGPYQDNEGRRKFLLALDVRDIAGNKASGGVSIGDIEYPGP